MDTKKDPMREEFKEREERISRIRKFLDGKLYSEMAAFLNETEPENTAEILGEFSMEEKLSIFGAIGARAAAVVLDDTDPETRRMLLRKVDKKTIGKILDEMPADEAADVIEEMAEEDRDDYLGLMEDEDAAEVEEILSYPEDSAGRVMNPDFVAVKYDDDVEDAIRHIRSVGIDEDFFYAYVVDGAEKLRGVVPLKKFLLSPKGTLIKDIVEGDVHSVLIDTDQEQAAGIMKKYDLLSLPVVDDKGKLVGRITADDIIDVIEEEQAEDISKMTGTIEEEYGTESTFKAAKNRFPWLITCMLGSILTGLVIQMFEVTLEEMIALVSFIPVITATGGNSGVQASTVVIRGIALGHMDISKLGEEAWRQLKIALGLGIVCGMVLTILASIWKANSVVGLIAGLSIFLVVVWSNFVGVSVPLMFKKMNIDPALASGPLITTLNDIIGVFIYLSVAAFLLN
ncbi:MAG: magnesium transporter [Candidatus Omnitrophica bacterium]|nr:magnesium transporter [Candidatus Omnitrophota bacterium]MBU1128428.1 magnesium transporter [Candidatus Omnitrophota bacterium]MBU1656619.1 magnesium transporter [Candidatus Omnitrophota bacterium]MBU1784978.1 magnesium transporter [Candidatus Omnitrophota bacterium]MBU1851793.1 magnesium transporter [Candidatus Omnitrophota bacterium]